MEAGAAQAGLGRAREAEALFHQALRKLEAERGPDHPSLGDPLMHLALAASQDGRFEEAGLLFERADPLVQKAAEPALLPRFLSYYALHQ